MKRTDTKISKTVYERLLNQNIELMPTDLIDVNGGPVPNKFIEKGVGGSWLRKHYLPIFVSLYEQWLKLKGVEGYEVSKKGVYYRKSD